MLEKFAVQTQWDERLDIGKYTVNPEIDELSDARTDYFQAKCAHEGFAKGRAGAFARASGAINERIRRRRSYVEINNKVTYIERSRALKMTEFTSQLRPAKIADKIHFAGRTDC